MWQFKRGKRNLLNQDIDPDEIFLDSENIPDYDNSQFEGRIERPVGKGTIIILSAIFLLVGVLYSTKVWALQIKNGDEYLTQSEIHRLRFGLSFADRGNISDRNGTPLAWNETKSDYEFDLRKYIDAPGFSNLLGYIRYPQKDKSGFYYEVDFEGMDGIENSFNDIIKGENGLKIIEINAVNEIISQSTVRDPSHGNSITLTIDSEIQTKLYESIEKIALQTGFSGGGGVIMDVETGELLALVTYPEYDSNILSSATSTEALARFQNNPNNPFLHRVIDGLYTPGSIVKPYVAVGALQEGIIAPDTNILSTKYLEVPNKYNPDNPTRFADWKAHGLVNVKRALAMSSNIYFYVVGGGFNDQEGLGIVRLEKYLRMFGFGQSVRGSFFEGPIGTIPNPKWKEENFDGDPWRIGDTYFTSIGQYGFQVTPLQVVRAVSALANGGKLVEPVIVSNRESQIIQRLEVSENVLQIVREGMREGVTSGTVQGLNMDNLHVAGKTGTAELGVSKANVNSWVTGFFPYENPKYAFVVVMEKGDSHNLIGGVAVMRGFFDWLRFNRVEFLD